MQKKSKLKQFIKSPKRALITLSIPVIAAAVVETLYNIVDAIFVGRLGAGALAAITFAWPFFFILVAVSLGINAGMSSRIARFLGEKNKKQAENTALHGLFISLFVAVLIMIIGIPTSRFLFALSGASGIVLQMATDYMFVILLGVIFMFLSYAINSIFASQGDTKTAMKIDIYSLVLNIILTPIFIFIFHLGIRGAALGTSISVLFAFIQSLYYLHKVSYLDLHLKSFKFSLHIVKEITSVGLPSTVMMMIISFYIIFLNKAMVHFSINHVAVFGVVSRLESIAILPIYGLSIGSMTLTGMFFGAKKYKLLEQISWYAIKISAVVTSLIGVVFFMIPDLLLKAFISNSQVISLGIPYIRLDIFTFPLMAITMIVSRIMQGLGYGIPGLIITLIRVLIVAVPLAYFFVFVLGYGYLSIAIAMILGGTTATVVGLIWLRKTLNPLLRKETSAK
jgi:putative MATE family efflux protein